MKTHPISLGNFCLALSIVPLLSACSLMSRRAGAGLADARPPLSEEVRLKEDRSHLDELRKDVQPEVKQDNDELAYILKLVHDRGGDETPERIRDRFSREARKRRDQFEREMRSARQDLDRQEKKRREEFLAKQKESREDFASSKPKAEERNRFFNDLETERRNFFSGERETREDFESRMREKRRDFDDSMRGIQARFDAEIRDYTRDYRERQMQKEKERYSPKPQPPRGAGSGTQGGGPSETQGSVAGGTVGSNAVATGSPDPDLAEFDRIPKGPRIPLQTEPTGN